MKCIYCSLEGDWLCNKCLDLVKRDNYNLCPICEVENSNGAVCGFCRKNSNLDGLMVVLENSQLNQKIIHLVKYNFITELLNYIKPKIFSCINNNPNWRDYFVLVPVPLHRRRFLERGFNQSEIISNIIGEVKGNIINNQLLAKVKYHRHQVGLNAKQRKLNIVDSFAVNDRCLVDFNKTLVIVDDVYTTGSTMEECAKTLKEYGYQKVWGLVLIKG